MIQIINGKICPFGSVKCHTFRMAFQLTDALRLAPLLAPSSHAPFCENLLHFLNKTSNKSTFGPTLTMCSQPSARSSAPLFAPSSQLAIATAPPLKNKLEMPNVVKIYIYVEGKAPIVSFTLLSILPLFPKPKMDYYNYDRLMAECPNEIETIKFFQTNGLLHKERYCDCGSEMRGSTRTQRDTVIPVWRCTSKFCKTTKGLRPATWFDNSTLSFHSILKFIYWWSAEQTSVNFCRHEIDMGHDAVVDWSMYMREACAESLLKHNGRVGGQGLTVEVDEALFSKRKNNIGRVLPEQWVFGGVCRETKDVFMVAVPNRTAETLLAVIRERIVEGTTIMSDCWRAYNMVGADGTYRHLTVNHSCNFIDPLSGAHTQNIERTWRSAKARNKRHSAHTDRCWTVICVNFCGGQM